MKKIIISLAILLTSFAITSQASDWLKPYQNSRNDREEVNIKLPLKKVWTRQNEIGHASPVYMNGKLYLQSKGGLIGKWFGEYLYINEIDIEKGKVKKKYRVAKLDKYRYIRMIGHDNKLFLSTIWSDEEFREQLIHINVYTYDINKKKKIWNWYSGPLDTYPGPQEQDVGAYMTADDNKLIVANMGVTRTAKAYCFNTSTGELLWKQKEPAGEIANSYPVIADGKVIVGTRQFHHDDKGGHIAALDLETGKVIWDKELIVADESKGEGLNKWDLESDTSLIHKNDRFYASLRQPRRLGELKSYRIDDGQELWSSGFVFRSSIWKSAVIDEEGLYVAGFEYNVNKVDKNTGKLIWQSNYSFPVIQIQNSKWIMASSSGDGMNYLIMIDKENGQEISRIEVPGVSGTSRDHVSEVAVVGDNQILVKIEDRTWYLFQGSE